MGLVDLLPCYLKSVAITFADLAIWPCLCKFLFSVQNKRRKKMVLSPAGLFCLCSCSQSHSGFKLEGCVVYGTQVLALSASQVKIRDA